MRAHKVALVAVVLSVMPNVAWGQARRPARADRVPVPVTGRTLQLRLNGGESVEGELIEADERSLLLWGDTGFRSLDLGDVLGARYRRHGFGTPEAFLWVGLGALITGAGMTAACVQVEDTSCGGVFPAMAFSWAFFGGIFAGMIAHGQMQDLDVSGDALRPYARFPQGAPLGFRERVEASREGTN